MTNSFADMLKVYSVDHSLYCAKLRLVLRTKRLEWHEVDPPTDYLRLVPTGNLPALVDGDLTLTDSEAIAEYLNEAHPTPAMLPTSLIARAQSRERSRFHDTRLEPALRLLFSNVTPSIRNLAEVDVAHAEITKRLIALTALLQIPLPRDRLWLGDCGLVVTLEWLEIMEKYGVTPPLTWSPEIREYQHDMSQLSAVQAELAHYRPHMRDWMDSKHT